MTINLQNYSVDTVREVYDWAHQNAEIRKLSQPQVESAKALLTTLPSTVESIPFGKGVHLSIWREGNFRPSRMIARMLRSFFSGYTTLVVVTSIAAMPSRSLVTKAESALHRTVTGSESVGEPIV
jgi:hypothetical protein